MSKATRRQYELKYALLEARLREQLDNTNKILNDEEFRMTSGEHLASILSDHEVTQSLIFLVFFLTNPPINGKNVMGAN